MRVKNQIFSKQKCTFFLYQFLFEISFIISEYASSDVLTTSLLFPESDIHVSNSILKFNFLLLTSRPLSAAVCVYRYSNVEKSIHHYRRLSSKIRNRRLRLRLILVARIIEVVRVVGVRSQVSATRQAVPEYHQILHTG